MYATRILVRTKYSMVLNASIMVDINDNVYKFKLLEVAHGPKKLMEISKLHEDSSEVKSSEEEDDASYVTEEGEAVGETHVPETNDVMVPPIGLEAEKSGDGLKARVVKGRVVIILTWRIGTAVT